MEDYNIVLYGYVGYKICIVCGADSADCMHIPMYINKFNNITGGKSLCDKILCLSNATEHSQDFCQNKQCMFVQCVLSAQSISLQKYFNNVKLLILLGLSNVFRKFPGTVELGEKLSDNCFQKNYPINFLLDRPFLGTF